MKKKYRMKYLFSILLVVFSVSINAQEDEFDETEIVEEEEEYGVYRGSEIGADLAFSASTFGGNFGIGLKYGVALGDYFLVGPCVRYDRTWIKNNTTGFNGNYNVYGGGAFVHARFVNALFLGAEFEYLKSPYDINGLLNTQGTWCPTLFVGGGFSMEFNEIVRLNVGIMYDVINAENSPFRNSYSITTKDANGSITGYLPIIYRIAFFVPLGR